VLTEEQRTEIQRVVEYRFLELLQSDWFSTADPKSDIKDIMQKLQLQITRENQPLTSQEFALSGMDSQKAKLFAQFAQARLSLSSALLEISQPQLLEPLVRVIARAVEVLGSSEKALRWINAPVRSLGDQTPVSLLASPEGITRVEDALGRIEHGVW
jgi:putative toxin-antitoxin system antitoxin component (TIGR02293 family)